MYQTSVCEKVESIFSEAVCANMVLECRICVFLFSSSLSAWGSSNHKSSVRISESLFHKPSETVVFRSYHCSVTAWHSNVSDLYIVHVVKYTACHRRELQWLYVTALKIWSSGIEFFYLCQRAPIQVSTGSGLFSTSLGLRPGKCQYEHCTVLYLLKSCNSLEHFWELHCTVSLCDNGHESDVQR